MESTLIENAGNFLYENFYYTGSALFFVVAVFGLLPTIYQFQVKEYLWYRLLTKVNDEGIGLIPFKLPKKSIRNLLIFVGASILILGLYLLIAYLFTKSENEIGNFILGYYLITLALGLVVSKLFAGLMMLLTEPLASMVREKKIKRAKLMLSTANPALVRILITGSYGKTSTKELLSGLMTHLGKKIQFTRENHNTDLGISLDIIKYLDSQTEIFCAEVGAYTRGHIAKVSQFFRPTVGILTALGNQHLNMFGSRDNLIAAKMELFMNLLPGSVFFYNMDIDRTDLAKVKAIIATRKDIVSYSYSSEDPSADIFLQDVVIFPEGARLVVIIKGVEYKFGSQLKITHNVSNLLPAIGYAILELKLNPSVIEKAIADLKEETGRLRILSRGEVTLLLDNYNSTKEGFLSAISEMDHHEGEKYIFTKGIIELGHEKQATYQEIIARAKLASATICSTDKHFGAGKSSEKKMQNMLEEFILSEKKYTILIEGRFSPKFNSILQELIK